MRVADLFSLAQIPKFGIVLVVVLVLGALGFRDRKEIDVLQLICSAGLIAKRSGIFEDEHDDEHEDDSSNSEFRLNATRIRFSCLGRLGRFSAKFSQNKAW